MARRTETTCDHSDIPAVKHGPSGRTRRGLLGRAGGRPGAVEALAARLAVEGERHLLLAGHVLDVLTGQGVEVV
jgi:hypothetical protein